MNRYIGIGIPPPSANERKIPAVASPKPDLYRLINPLKIYNYIEGDLVRLNQQKGKPKRFKYRGIG